MTDTSGLIDLGVGLFVVGAASKFLHDSDKPFSHKRKHIKSMREGSRK